MTPSAHPSSSVVGAKAATTDQALRPPVFLPDTVLWFDRKFSEQFKEREEYRSFEGFRNYQATEDRSFPKFLVFLDYRQVFDRSYSEMTWGTGQILSDNVEFLQRLKGLASSVWGSTDAVQVFIVSHIHQAEKNLEHFLEAVSATQELCAQNPISAIYITRERCGPRGKLATARAISLDFVWPSVIIDDNLQVVQEFSDSRIHTCHIKLRRKPPSQVAECSKPFLADCARPLHELFLQYQ